MEQELKEVEIEYRKFINEKDTPLVINIVNQFKEELAHPVFAGCSPQDFGYSFGIFVGNITALVNKLDKLTQVIKKS